MPRVSVRKKWLALLMGEAHWGPTGQTAGKVLGPGGVNHLHTASVSLLPFSLVKWAWEQWLN